MKSNRHRRFKIFCNEHLHFLHMAMRLSRHFLWPRSGLKIWKRFGLLQTKISDIYKIKHSEGGPVIVTDETTEIVSFTLEMAKETEGALDPTIYPILITWGFTTHKHRVSDKKEIIQLLNLVNYQEVASSENTIRLNLGMILDLDAVGKGYASDEVSEIL